MTNRRNLDAYGESFFGDPDETYRPEDTCTDCGRRTVGEFCGQCGMPLCSMCAECGAGFCSRHPDKHFKGF